MSFDYEMMRCITWGLLWLLIIHFSLTGGYYLGVSILFPFLAETDEERYFLIKSLGNTWNGHQIGFIAMMILLFSAWSIAYSVLFTAFNYLLFLTIILLLLRPFLFYYRNKFIAEKWLYLWDKALFLSGFIPVFIFGLAIGNLLKGIPFHLDSDMRIIYYGDFWGLLNPFALLTAITTLGLFSFYGASYIQLKTEREVTLCVKGKLQLAAIITILGFILTGLWVMRLEGYHIESEILANGVSNPLAKFVKRGEGLWLDNYEHIPALMAIPILALISCGLTVWLSTHYNKLKLAFICSEITIVCMISTVALSMFPFMLPSNMSLNSSLSLWDSSSSYHALQFILLMMAISLPIILISTRWFLKLFQT